ncbi:MAG: carbohydrate kinase family protein [Candidatus Pacebacteria bacterium]|jgi:ribokinase|nr:carbohydrate kinase family protein [Candidatus Paceibacterota bacterium]MBT4652424.1 carbohydrate kinase family protein [Candidatus Paceibacterota bacterium]MBT6756251.1 carbohydrate kinase family protein [Candidatus Paceibacterota bacterium]MBT6921542.1 carbohydrate kinase family protein [Candidatus Paceibacterota bacterium]
MHDFISIGSSLVDMFIHSDKFKVDDLDGENRFVLQGDKVDIESFVVRIGGGGANTATGFTRLGFDAAVISETGKDDFANVIFRNLQKNRVDTSLIIKEKREITGGSVILVSGNGRRTVMVHRGAASMLDSFDISPYRLTKARWVHLSSISGRLETLKRIFELVKVNPELKLSWNPGSKELALLADGKINIEEIPCLILFLNAKEWELVRKQQKQLIKEIPQIVVTKGAEGGEVYIHGEKSLKFFGAKSKSVDDTGAGDAFATGYVAGQYLNLPPKTSVEWGVRNAGSVIRYFGAQTGLLGRDRIKG